MSFRCAFKGCSAAAIVEAFVTTEALAGAMKWTIACDEHRRLLEGAGVKCVPLGSDALAALELQGAARVGGARRGSR